MDESQEKDSLNTPGGDAVRDQVGGKGAGLPYFAFLDERAETIITSRRPVDGKAERENIGYPYKPEEIDWFLEMLHKAAPRMSAEEAAVLEHWLRTQPK